MVNRENKKYKRTKNNKGFTLAELMIAAVILVLAFVGILLTYIHCMELSEMSRNSSRSLLFAKTRMEDIKNSPLANMMNFNNQAFSVTAGFGAGASYVDNTNPDLFEITVSYCWRQKNGRVIGEDADLDGVLDAGEDANGNGILDSPVQLVTYIFNG